MPRMETTMNTGTINPTVPTVRTTLLTVLKPLPLRLNSPAKATLSYFHSHFLCHLPKHFYHPHTSPLDQTARGTALPQGIWLLLPSGLQVSMGLGLVPPLLPGFRRRRSRRKRDSRKSGGRGKKAEAAQWGAPGIWRTTPKSQQV